MLIVGETNTVITDITRAIIVEIYLVSVFNKWTVVTLIGDAIQIKVKVLAEYCR